jgi:phosphopantetheinyl transferase
MLADLPAVFVSHDNCDHQAILCGPHGAIEEAQARLRAARVLFEVLPFRSGFHSPALARQVDYYVSHLDRVAFRAPSVPMWSATTCTPYPADDAAIRELFRDHLLQPVRFRELVQALYADGVRVFVQVGTGSLCAFVDDVLAGKPHQAVNLVSAYHAGMDQLRRACAALYVEGAGVDLAQVGLAATAPIRVRPPLSLALSAPLIKLDVAPIATTAKPANGHDLKDPLMAAFADNMREILQAQDAVREALAKRSAGTVDQRSDTLVLSVATYPELADHGLIPQPNGWPVLEDFAPAVPMTMSIALIVEAAQKLEPSRVAVAVENVQAQKWLRVEPAATIVVTAKRVDADRVQVSLGEYFEGTVSFADRYAPPPSPSAEPIKEPQPFPIAAGAVYRDGWLFHGPSYQGIERFAGFGSNGLDGTLRATDAKGSLLDNAGQLVGLWMMHFTASDRLAMPIRVRRIDFYAPEPAAGETVECTARIRHLGRHDVRADLEVVRGGRVAVRITGWEDWRFYTGDNIFEVMRQPGTVIMARPQECFVVVRDPGWSSATIDFLARRFLSCAEVEAEGGIAQVMRRRDWLIGRVAAKDAIRRHLFERGTPSLFPVEIAIGNDAAGRPHARGPWTADLRISIAHKHGIGCAIVGEAHDVGIDVEKIDARSEGFTKLAYGDDELRKLVRADDEWKTRLWAAKEAAGKALGTGMQGDPRRLVLTAADGERLRIGERWVTTRRDGVYAYAWTD